MAGIDYYINESAMLTGSVNYRRSDGLNKSTYVFRDYDENETLIRTVTRREREEEPEDNGEVALRFRKDYGPRKDHYLTADFKWIENVETEYSTFLEYDDASDTQIDQRASNTENERNVLFQLDFVKPFGQRGKIEAGAKSTLRVIDNDFIVEPLSDKATREPVGEVAVRTAYTETIHAAYAICAHEVNRFTYQLGLRGDLTNVSAVLSRQDKATYQH